MTRTSLLRTAIFFLIYFLVIFPIEAQWSLMLATFLILIVVRIFIKVRLVEALIAFVLCTIVLPCTGIIVIYHYNSKIASPVGELVFGFLKEGHYIPSLVALMGGFLVSKYLILVRKTKKTIG